MDMLLGYIGNDLQVLIAGCLISVGMKINSDELADYVRAVLEGICKGVSQDVVVNDETDTFSLSSPVKFQVGITSSLEARGEVKIFVAGLHGGKSSEQQARIEFEVSNQSTNFLEAVDKAVSIYAKLPEKDQNAVKSMGSDLVRRFAAEIASQKGFVEAK